MASAQQLIGGRQLYVIFCRIVITIGPAIFPAKALNPDRQVSQYGHTAWRLADGVFEGAPHAITQTADGYLWIGTETGLVRFDGTRFVPWVAPAGKSLASTSIYSLASARDGSLWIGTASGLAHWTGRKLLNYPETAGRINAIVEDREGTVWMVRSRPRDARGPLCRVKNNVVQCYGAADGISFPYAEALVDDRNGGLWIGSTVGLSHWQAGYATNYFPDPLRHVEGSTGVEALALAADGSLLVGVGQRGAGLGMQTITQGIWKPYPMPATDASDLAVSALLTDRDNGVWIAIMASGLYHVSAGRTDRFRQTDGLSSDTVSGFYQDREGNIWTVSPRGIDRFRDVAVATVSKREGLTADVVGSVFAAPNGNVWIGNGRALVSLNKGRFSTVLSEGGLPGKSVTSLLEDHAGRLWLGVDTGLAVLENGRLRSVRKDRSNPLGMVIGLAEDTDHDIWALITGRPERLLRIRNFQIAEEIIVPDSAQGAALAANPMGGIWLGHLSGDLTRYRAGGVDLFRATDNSGTLRNVIVDSDGSVWAASANGLVRWKDGTRQRLDRRNGLPCDGIFSLIRDDSGNLWLYSACGVVAVTAGELEKWWRHPNISIAARLFDVFDGAQPGATPFAPAASRASDGRLWFTNSSALQVIDPRRLPRNQLQPPVRIEQLVTDGRNYVPGESMRLPATTRNVQIDYTALSFVVPQKVRFRYKLEGRDEKWLEAGTRRQAFYNDLAPRSYRFRVTACNNDGVWSEEGASWSFSVLPAYYQTVWFRLLFVLASLLALWGFYQWRVWGIAAGLAARFDERMTERNRLATELHDTFLQSVQASKMIADQALFDEGANPVLMRGTIVTLSEWLAHAISDGQAALNALQASATLRNDLAAAFQRAAEVSGVTSSMKFVLTVEGVTREVHPVVRDDVYRIGSEAIRNALLHSEAGTLVVKLTYADDLIVRLSDDGKGISRGLAAGKKPDHTGLAEMQKRAIGIGGQFRLFSRENSGTEIELRVPGRIAYRDTVRRSVFAKLRSLWRQADHR